MDLLALFPLPAVLSVSLPEFLTVSLMVLPEFLTAYLMVLPEFPMVYLMVLLEFHRTGSCPPDVVAFFWS